MDNAPVNQELQDSTVRHVNLHILTSVRQDVRIASVDQMEVLTTHQSVILSLQIANANKMLKVKYLLPGKKMV